MALGGVLFKSIKELFHDRFDCSKIVNIARSCNASAHKIVRVALCWDPGQSFIWFDPLPELVIDVVTRNLAEFMSFNTRP